MSKKFTKLESPDKTGSKDVEDNLNLRSTSETSETEVEKTHQKPSIIDRYSGYGGAFLLGLSLGSAFIPCVTPMYASILTLSIQYESSVQMYLMLFYALGLTLPYVIIGPLMGKFTSRIVVKLIKYGSKIQKIFSLILLWVGIEIILTGFGFTGILTII